MRRFLFAGLFLLLPALAFSVQPQGPQPSADAVHLPPQALEAYAGRYQLAPGFVLKIFRRGDQLYAQATGQGAAPIYQGKKGEFYYKIVDAQISFTRNATGKITGLVLHQNGDHPAPRITSSTNTAQAPARSTWIATASVGAKTLPITVRRNGFALKGVLNLPAGKGPFPVVDLIPGSGPVTLNGNDGPITYSPYKKLATVLVKAGWAVARIAKRGMAPSNGNGNQVVFNDQVVDNLAIVESLRKNPHVNPKLIVVAGHSIGGLIAPQLATETRIAGLILLEAPGEPMTKITTAQVMEIDRQAGASATQLKAIAQKQVQFYNLIAKTPPGQTVQFETKTIPSNEVQLLKSWYAQKPLATASKVKVPVLVVQGGMDFNVPPGNGKRLINALSNGTLLYLPKMGHALDVASCRCVKQLDTGKDATLAPGLASGIVRWLKQLKP
jgi:pimeloyl-ACP methyl ester carboxylesterase